MGYRIGVDIGGTFADFCALDETTGKLSTLKVLSTPAEPGREVITGLGELVFCFRRVGNRSWGNTCGWWHRLFTTGQGKKRGDSEKGAEAGIHGRGVQSDATQENVFTPVPTSSASPPAASAVF